jgi:Transcriptional regulator
MRTVDPIKHEEKRREILEAAGRCFVRKGFQGATISSICAEAKISPGHLYHYFASKEAIIQEMAKARLEATVRFFSKAVDGADVLATILAGVEAAMTGAKHLGQEMRIDMLAEAGRNPAMAKIIEENSKALQAQISDFLRKGQASGQIDPGLDPMVTAGVMLSISDGLKTLSLRNSRLDVEKNIHVLKTLFARFLAPPKS